MNLIKMNLKNNEFKIETKINYLIYCYDYAKTIY